MSQQIWVEEFHPHHDARFGIKVDACCFSKHSAYQKIEVWQSSYWGNVLINDECIQVTSKDHFIYHEMMAHPVLFTHPAPVDIAIIGGGDCGVLTEVLKHREVQHAYQVDIDVMVTEVARQFFPELTASSTSERAHLVFENGLHWLQDQAEASLDIIIVDATDPIGPCVDLYQDPFYQACFRALRDGGLMVQQSESPLWHEESILLPMRAHMRQAGFSSINTSFFPLPSYPSGWWSATIAGKEADTWAHRLEDCQQRDFGTRYYNEAIHQSAQAAPHWLACRFAAGE